MTDRPDQATLFDAGRVLPSDHADAVLVGRALTAQGPTIITVRDAQAVDITATVPTITHLLRSGDPVGRVRAAEGGVLTTVAALATNAVVGTLPRLLAPVDLQALKACGVTFVNSMLERVVEEMANGDPARAAEMRALIEREVAGDIRSVRPGSEQARRVKAHLQARTLWSQYLEVGLGEDAEVFTKGQPLSSLGFGDTVGLHPRSAWNNPEPELVLIGNPAGQIVAATLGNDVNLRDVEGRSALLLGRAKDNNGSCSLGPFLRLLDDGYTLDHLRRTEIDLTIAGADGFHLDGRSSVAEISRDLVDLMAQAFDCHQYPDGMVLFTGTLFAPTQDRDRPGEGFTHKPGDVVAIASDRLGRLTNRVGQADAIPPWTFGTVDLVRSLADRGIRW